jgi:hypothetical protein
MSSRMAASRSIAGEWVHAHERDHDRVQVFVSAASALPPSRGRRRLHLLPDGTFKESRPGVDDRLVAAAGVYTWDGERLRLNFADPSRRPPSGEAALSADGASLELQRPTA